jgi:hypothetical protein
VCREEPPFIPAISLTAALFKLAIQLDRLARSASSGSLSKPGFLSEHFPVLCPTDTSQCQSGASLIPNLFIYRCLDCTHRYHCYLLLLSALLGHSVYLYVLISCFLPPITYCDSPVLPAGPMPCSVTLSAPLRA